MKWFAVLSIFSSLFSIDAIAAEIVDGDTIKQNGITYRLEGIDAPEYGQKCNSSNGKTWACGKQSTLYLKQLITGEQVTCVGHETDGFGRTLATCHIATVEINKHMVEVGLAWAFRKFSKNYIEIEDQARSKGFGIWQAETQTAWDYRAAKWEVAVQALQDGCPIKGNISKNGLIYHPPWSPWYSRTKISLNKGERWFCNEAEAIAAGWRAPLWGR